MDSSNAQKDGPKRLGDFEIIRELGRGGMGVVYEARQRSLNRLVALKVLSTGMGLTTKAVMRFKREAEAAAKLHHTNIVPIYSTGDENRVPYYAMELIDGPSLDQVIRQMRSGPVTASAGSLDTTADSSGAPQHDVPSWLVATTGFAALPSEGATSVSDSDSGSASSIGSGSTFYDNIASMMAEVADALAHAHDHGVVHRDIKPSNLLLAPDGRLSVNDFGLARMLEQPGMTMTGEFVGSPAYMSPEQITAGRIPLDHRTDIYSLGATLYELLTLQPPFTGQQRDQVLSQIIHKEPSRPRSLNKRIPKDLETICLKAMEKDPDRRYQTADQMAKDLRCYVSRHAISARRTGPVERGIRWARKNRALTAMACLTLVVGLFAGMIVYRSSLAEQQLHREREQMLREQAMEDALTAAMSGKLVKALECIDLAGTYGAKEDWTLVLQSQVNLFEGKPKEALEKLELAVKLNPDNVTAQSMLASAYGANGRWAEYQERAQQLEGLQAITAEEKLFKGKALTFYSTEQAIGLMDDAIRMRPDFYLARVMRANARVYQALVQGHDPDRILEALNQLEIASEFLPQNPLLSQARLYTRLAAVHHYQRAGDKKLADTHLQQAEVDVRHLDEFPRYFLGNFVRLHYYNFRSDLPGMQRVMEDVIKYGHRGFLSDCYWAALYREGRFADALNQLDRLPHQNDKYVIFRRVLFQLEMASGQMDSQERIEEIYNEFVQQLEGNMQITVLVLLGKREEAVDRAGQAMESLPKSKHLGFALSAIQYFVGHINEDALIAQAQTSERKLVEAYWGIGLRKLSRGDRAGARQSFEKSANRTLYHWTAFIWSREFAVRMEEDPNWPAWLPAEPIGVENK